MLSLGAGIALAGVVAWQAARLRAAVRRGHALAQLARPFEHRPGQPVARVLLLGDSTGVGVGAGRPEATLPGLLAAAYPQVEIVNRCRNGARTADALQQLLSPGAGGRCDLALVLVGGNDVLHHTPHARLRRDAQALLAALALRARHVVWLGSANVGGSPVLPWPLAAWFTWRTRRTMGLLAGVARRGGAQFIDFFRPPGQDLFARRAGIYFAGDGVHPSAHSYRHCFEVLRRQAPLHALLTPS